MKASVAVRTYWDKDKEQIRTDGARLGDAIVEVSSPTRRQLIEDLNSLARIIAGSYDDLEGGDIVIVRRRRRPEKSR